MAGLQILPMDLAHIGQLMITGEYDGKRLLSPEWVAASLTPHPLQPDHGLMWWLTFAHTRYRVDQTQFDALLTAGVAPAFVERLRPVTGTWPDTDAYYGKLSEVLGEGWQDELMGHLQPAGISLSAKEYGPVVGFAGRGYLGQYLVVLPEKGIVGVRMIERSETYDEQTDGFDDFEGMVAALAKR
jgi:CubicO group peptidase (beta-lactamase class C family)